MKLANQKFVIFNCTSSTNICWIQWYGMKIDCVWQAHLNLQARAVKKSGRTGGGYKRVTSFLKATTTTVHHSINENEKASYVAHVNSYLAEDSFLKKYLPLDPATNALFDLAKDGVLLW